MTREREFDIRANAEDVARWSTREHGKMTMSCKTGCMIAPRMRTGLPWALLLAIGGCAAATPPDSAKTDAAPSPSEPAAHAPATAGETDPVLDALPAMPEGNGTGEPFALERGMGAECYGPGEHAPWFTVRSMVSGACEGAMPRHMARAWREIARLLPVPRRADAETLSEVYYRTVPGFGARRDVVVEVDKHTFRSFEGKRPEDTVYAVWGSFCRMPDRTPVTNCQEPPSGRLVFRIGADGKARDVTALVMPAPPVLDAADEEMLRRHTADEIFELRSKLGDVPTTRWIAEYDPENPPPASYRRMYGEYRIGHFGFVVWDGTRFRLVERVQKHLWPCRPHPADPCVEDVDLPPDSELLLQKGHEE